MASRTIKIWNLIHLNAKKYFNCLVMIIMTGLEQEEILTIAENISSGKRI
jgi:hypothetical protein